MLSRLSVIRRVARVPTIRYYTDGRSAGSVPQMRGGGIGYVSQAYSSESYFDQVLIII